MALETDLVRLRPASPVAAQGGRPWHLLVCCRIAQISQALILVVRPWSVKAMKVGDGVVEVVWEAEPIHGQAGIAVDDAAHG